MLDGRVMPWTRDAQKAVAKDPPKMAGPLIYAMQHVHAEIPGMDYARNMDVSWLERYCPAMLSLLPPRLREMVTVNLGAVAEPMTEDDRRAMLSADFRRCKNQETE